MGGITICISDGHCTGIQPYPWATVLVRSSDVGGNRRVGVLLKVRDVVLQGKLGLCSPQGSRSRSGFLYRAASMRTPARFVVSGQVMDDSIRLSRSPGSTSQRGAQESLDLATSERAGVDHVGGVILQRESPAKDLRRLGSRRSFPPRSQKEKKWTSPSRSV